MFPLILALVFLNFNFSYGGIANYLRWSSPEIDVCFADKTTDFKIKRMQGGSRDWKANEKKLIQKVLEEEFTPNLTGYTFVGFKDCDQTSKVQVIVGVKKGLSSQNLLGYRGAATTGVQLVHVSSKYPKAKGAVFFSPSGMNKGTITHEFAHVLGLLHEHEHPSAKEEAQETCGAYKKNIKPSHGRIYTDFDESSIMNYCFLHSREGERSGLSHGDRNLILDIFNEKYVYRVSNKL